MNPDKLNACIIVEVVMNVTKTDVCVSASDRWRVCM